MFVRSLGLLAALAPILAPAAQADTVVHSAFIAMEATPWMHEVVLPRFDPALGRLDRVNLILACELAGSLGVENTSAIGVDPVYRPRARVSCVGPGSADPAPLITQYSTAIPALAAFDGTLDFAGISGYSALFSGITTNSIGTTTAGSGMDLWSGPMGAPGDVALTVRATDTTAPPTPAEVQAVRSVSVRASVSVTYFYTRFPAAVCSFQTSGCPCSNPAALGHGCGNSINPSGAQLTVLGTASIAGDTLTLVGSGMTNSSALYVQAAAFTLGGTLLGDGRMCAAGPVLRLGTRSNSGGASQYPSAGDASVSVRGLVPGPGSTRLYQVYYRDLGVYCLPATANLTNGIVLTWVP